MKRRHFSGKDRHDSKKHVREEETQISTNAVLYNRHFPYFREPKEIGSFSIDLNRRFCDDRSQLKMYVPPPDYDHCCFDLRKGYEKMIRKDESVKSYINDLLQWIVLHKDKFIIQSDSGKRDQHLLSLNTDFVCWRGLLTRIMCLPYENREDLRIAVIRFKGTYFLCQLETEAKRKREEEMTDRDKQMCAWGWKFEQYVTADKPNGIPDTEKPVNNNEEYGTVVRSRLGSHSLVYGAEVDCTDPDDQRGERYLELKTSRIITAKRQHESFCRFKLIKFWAQSFLIGIQKIVCGFRDDDGIVRNLRDYIVKDIPKIASSALRDGFDWNPSVCFNFLDSFLNLVKSSVSEDDERCVHVFYWKPGSKLVHESKGDDRFYFLPEWFVNGEHWDKPDIGGNKE